MEPHPPQDSESAAPASERVRIGDDYYILASALAPRQRWMLLSHGNSFAIFDLSGDIPLAGTESCGLFHCDTRFLDRFELRLNRKLPVLLSSAPSDDGSELVSHLSNADERRDGEVILVRHTVAVCRSKTLWDGSLFERLHLHNYGPQALQLEIELFFSADFADVFELRGLERSRSGEVGAPEVQPSSVRMSYRGLDGVQRQTVLTFSPAPDRLSANAAYFRVDLQPGAQATFEIAVRCCLGREPTPPTHTFISALAGLRTERRRWYQQFAQLHADHEGFNAWLRRSAYDLALLRATTAQASYIHAGIPWFATIFGRDGLITALQTLSFFPAVTQDIVRTLAALQGREHNAERDEEPGKIIHEMRYGEMAAVGEVPFGRYYGSIDATPLFVLLLAEYAERTADLTLVQELWPAAVAAMQWIDRYGDSDGDGYIEYSRLSPRGLVNQGWKDSYDAVFHADGRLAAPPIALAEVQAYVYGARRGLARLARRLERQADAAAWDAKASVLQERFNHDFWMAEEDTFALALDGDKRPCRVVSSNAGQVLLTGIAQRQQAERTMARLMREDMFCGWGIRTLSAFERRYNPMSYHNGSVWPHDNALIAAGFARHGGSDRACQLLSALFDVAMAVDHHRLPELFCGFPRHLQHSPVPYPVACKPQAWAAGSVFLLLQATLGLHVDAWERRVTLERPTLPAGLDRLDVRGLKIGTAQVDLVVERGRSGTAVEVITQDRDVEVVVR